MSDKLIINSGEKRIQINDTDNYLVFNPSDVVFVERFYKMITDFEAKLAEYQAKGAELDKADEVNELGIPVNMQERIDYIHEVCGFMYEQINFLFGEGTSKMLFGDSESLDMLEQFFSGLAPIVKSYRQKNVKKYLKK